MSRAKRQRRHEKATVQGWLRKVMEGLRAILRRAGPDGYADTRRPCHTCAFNPTTDTWRGFETTAWGLSEALLKDRPFYCHDNLPKDEQGDWIFDPAARVCAAWAVVVRDLDAKRAVIRGMVPDAISDAKADLLVDAMKDSMPPVAARKCTVPF